jgi:hypothetical protein
MWVRLTCHEFYKWPRHAQTVEAKIALRKRIVSWEFEEGLSTDTHPDGTCELELCLELWKEFSKSIETTSEEDMNLPRLGRSGAHDRRGGQGITFKHGDVAEI